MRPGIVARAGMRGIERYRAHPVHDLVGHSCRFTPTCSHYADDALNTRALPVALLLIAWRLLRCTPLTRMGTVDVVRRPRRGVGRRVAAVLGLSAITTLVVAGTAAAVSTTPQAAGSLTAGGCTAFVGGQPIGRLDSDHALQVHKGQRIVLTGQGPAAARASAVKYSSVTTAKIHFIEKIATRTVTEPGSGQNFQKSVNVNTYLKYGSGVYRVDVTSVSPGWSCSATFYVEMNGSKIAAEAAVAMGALGTAGMMASARGDQPGTEVSLEKDADGLRDPKMDAEQFEANERYDRAQEAKKDRALNAAANSGVGCLVGILFALLVMTFGAPESSLDLAVPAAAAAGASARPSRRVWVRGHPILGFISGLFAGIGVTVALQQFGFYALNLNNAIIAPLVVAVIGGVRGWKGTAWKVG